MSAMDLLTVKQVAEILGIAENTVKRHLAKGLIPGTKVGRLWRVRRVDIERMVDPTARPPATRPSPRRPARGK